VLKWGVVATLGTLLAASAATQKPLVVDVEDEPTIRYWWDEVPESIRNRSLTSAYSNIEPEDFVGPGACEECHEEKFESWSEHRHRWMNAPAGPEAVKGDFSPGASIHYFGGTAKFVYEDERYMMRLTKGTLARAYEVTQTIGSRFFQYYVGRQIEGPEPRDHPLYRSEHVLPFGFWLDRHEWVPVVHVEKTREGEPSLVDSMRRDPYRDPAVYDYAQSCSQCHTTLPTGDWLIHRRPSFPMSPRGFSFDLKSYVTDNHPALLRGIDVDAPDSAELEEVLRRVTHKRAPVWEAASGVSCEACHYGNKSHVDSGGIITPNMFPTSPRLFLERRSDGVDLSRNPTNQNWTCGRCHQGERFEFAAGMGTWNSTEHSDAMKGACYLSDDPSRPTLRCIDCHNPHETTGQSWSLTADEDDRLCVKCHESLAVPDVRAEHTNHPVGSAGSRCMNCHMPRINEGLQDMVRTHMIFKPTNRAMLEANQPNACNMCHVEETLSWTLGWLTTWYETTDVAHEESERPATLDWLRSWHPTTQMVAADVLTRAKADWALADVVESLDSKYMLVRQFAQIGLEDMLDTRLEELGYRFYMFEDERAAPLEAIRARYSPGVSPTGADITPVRDEDTEHYRSLVAFKPDSPTAHYYLGNALLEANEPDEAIDHYREALVLAPDFAQAHNNLGVALKERGDLVQAERHHLRALALEPSLADAHVALGNVYVEMERVEDASAQFTRALELAPEMPEAHYNLGLLHHAAGRLAVAIESYRSAVVVDPTYADAWNNLGIALAANDESSAAIDAFEQAVAVASGDNRASVHNNLGWALSLRGELDAAEAQFEAALDADAESVSARVGLAEILATHPNETRRDVDRAILLIEEALARTRAEDDPDLIRTLRQRLETYRSRL